MNKPVKILIVEDEGIIGLSLRLELENAGYDICAVAATGNDAVDGAARHKPDLVLMDIHLAGAMDGIEAASLIYAAQQTPIVFMTGYADKDLMERAGKLMPHAYIVKPVNIKILKQIIETIP